MADGDGLLLAGVLDEDLADERAGGGGAEQVLVLVDAASLHCGPDVLLAVFLARIDDIACRRSRFERALLNLGPVVTLSQVDADGDDVVVVVLLEPGDDDRLNQCGTEQESVKIGDIGSGGGLPGIPLAAAMPEYKFVLVERMDKRCAFLENCAAILGLSNVSVMKKEAEKVPAESFDVATFRAFRPLDEKMTKTLLNLTKKGGYLAAYKAKFSSIQTEMDGIKTLVKDYSVKKLTVPFLTENSSEQNRERNLVVIQKC